MLIVSVPQGHKGSITGLGDVWERYDTKGEFLDPIGFKANNHYPFQDKVSDFIVYGIGSMTGQKESVSDYDAGTGIIGAGGEGWILKFGDISFTGYDWLHFDVIGFVEGKEKEIPFWDINPGSHDVSTTTIPEPSTLLLLGAGLIGFGIFARRKFRS